MGELSRIRKILEEVRGMEQVLGASLISKGGLFVMGDTPPKAHQETFAAMSAIIIGAADTLSGEFKSELSEISVRMEEVKLMIVSAGVKYLVAVYCETGTDCESLVGLIRQGLEQD